MPPKPISKNPSRPAAGRRAPPREEGGDGDHPRESPIPPGDEAGEEVAAVPPREEGTGVRSSVATGREVPPSQDPGPAAGIQSTQNTQGRAGPSAPDQGGEVADDPIEEDIIPDNEEFRQMLMRPSAEHDEALVEATREMEEQMRDVDETNRQGDVTHARPSAGAGVSQRTVGTATGGQGAGGRVPPRTPAMGATRRAEPLSATIPRPGTSAATPQSRNVSKVGPIRPTPARGQWGNAIPKTGANQPEAKGPLPEEQGYDEQMELIIVARAVVEARDEFESKFSTDEEIGKYIDRIETALNEWDEESPDGQSKMVPNIMRLLERFDGRIGGPGTAREWVYNNAHAMQRLAEGNSQYEDERYNDRRPGDSFKIPRDLPTMVNEKSITRKVYMTWIRGFLTKFASKEFYAPLFEVNTADAWKSWLRKNPGYPRLKQEEHFLKAQSTLYAEVTGSVDPAEIEGMTLDIETMLPGEEQDIPKYLKFRGKHEPTPGLFGEKSTTWRMNATLLLRKMRERWAPVDAVAAQTVFNQYLNYRLEGAQEPVKWWDQVKRLGRQAMMMVPNSMRYAASDEAVSMRILKHASDNGNYTGCVQAWSNLESIPKPHVQISLLQTEWRRRNGSADGFIEKKKKDRDSSKKDKDKGSKRRGDQEGAPVHTMKRADWGAVVWKYAKAAGDNKPIRVENEEWQKLEQKIRKEIMDYNKEVRKLDKGGKGGSKKAKGKGSGRGQKAQKKSDESKGSDDRGGNEPSGTQLMATQRRGDQSSDDDYDASDIGLNSTILDEETASMCAAVNRAQGQEGHSTNPVLDTRVNANAQVWLIDSCCAFHATQDKANFIKGSLKTIRPERFVTVIGGKTIHQSGEVSLNRNVKLLGVKFIPGDQGLNILCAARLCDTGDGGSVGVMTSKGIFFVHAGIMKKMLKSQAFKDATWLQGKRKGDIYAYDRWMSQDYPDTSGTELIESPPPYVPKIPRLSERKVTDVGKFVPIPKGTTIHPGGGIDIPKPPPTSQAPGKATAFQLPRTHAEAKTNVAMSNLSVGTTGQRQHQARVADHRAKKDAKQRQKWDKERENNKRPGILKSVSFDLGGQGAKKLALSTPSSSI